MAFQGHFVGYDDLEKMLEATHHYGDVYANCIFETSPSQLVQMGMDNCSTIIQVSRIQGEVTHYWRWKVASVLLLATGEPFDPDKSRRARIAGESAWSAVRDQLERFASGQVIEAASSMPKNLNFLGGEQPAFLSYEKATGRYSLQESALA